jgi:acyl-CoA synthetase (NDP forming)
MTSAENPLRRLFHPRSIAVIGASVREDSISGRPLRILRQHGYGGALYPVNPRYDELLGLRCYPDVASVPEAVDVALVLVNAKAVPRLVRDCVDAGVRFAVVVSSGFAEQDDAGAAAQHELTELARTGAIRIAGPNAEGFVNLHGPVPLTFSPTVDLDRGAGRPLAGDVAVVSQSGGLGFSLFNDGEARGLGFSHVVTSGNEADLDAVDYAEFLVDDEHTNVILLLVEGLREPERFAALADRALAVHKPLVVAKAGGSEPGRRAAAAHTAHDAGETRAWDELLARPGILRADDTEEMVDVAFALSRSPVPRGPRVGVLSLSGGAGVWLADALLAEGLEVPVLDLDLQERIRPLIPPYGSPANPVDVTAQILELPGGVAAVLELLLASAQVDMTILVTSLSAPTRLEHEAARFGELVRGSQKPLVVYSYTRPHARSLELLTKIGVAWYPSIRRTARALRALHDYARAAASS